MIEITVTSTKDGYLAQSCAFDDTFWEANFNVQSTECNFIDHLMPDQVDAYIQTNGGGKFASSHAFRRMAHDHGYNITSTTPNASHQNGLVEKPHWTLKEQIWCMLYKVRLGVEFWSDVFLHATWLYNRTYHNAVKMTPFEAYTGRVPALDSLITFCTKITTKKSSDWPTTFHPWTYDGILLSKYDE